MTPKIEDATVSRILAAVREISWRAMKSEAAKVGRVARLSHWQIKPQATRDRTGATQGGVGVGNGKECVKHLEVSDAPVPCAVPCSCDFQRNNLGPADPEFLTGTSFQWPLPP